MITQVYALTTEAQEEKADEFYGPIQSEMTEHISQMCYLWLKTGMQKSETLWEKTPVRLIT